MVEPNSIFPFLHAHPKAQPNKVFRNWLTRSRRSRMATSGEQSRPLVVQKRQEDNRNIFTVHNSVRLLQRGVVITDEVARSFYSELKGSRS
jgi:hypothetical protein